tara:strand:+ start:3074 stop:3352 length:279 start_codon:yes stop_codon:yes gene_type:complete
VSRRPNPIPSIKLTTWLPEDVHTQLTLSLFSPLENRVPLGGYQAFLVARIREYFNRHTLDLAPYTGLDAGLHQIYGEPLAVATVKQLLEQPK